MDQKRPIWERQKWEVKHLLVQAIRCLAKAGIFLSYFQKCCLYSLPAYSQLSSFMSYWVFSYASTCRARFSPLYLQQYKHWLQLSILPRVSKCLQWVITHRMGWLLGWITYIESFLFTSPTCNFSCSHMVINGVHVHTHTHTQPCKYRVKTMCCSECLHSIWVIHCSPDPLLKMLHRTSQLANDSCQIPLIPPCWIRQFFDGVLAA